MPLREKVCPFTDMPCTDCCLLFAEEHIRDSEENRRGCDLLKKASKSAPR